MRILGISAFYHDSAAALVEDGRIVAAMQEERWTRVKHDKRWPTMAVEYCLAHANVVPRALDYVVFYERPGLKLDRVAKMVAANWPRSAGMFGAAMVAQLPKLRLARWIARHYGLRRDQVLFVDHHLSHAASAYYCSPYPAAAVLTVDGVGEWTTTAWGHGVGTGLTLSEEIHFPHSLGLLYSAFTDWLGFEVNEGEYKVMGLAAFGTPKYREDVEKVVRFDRDGSFELDLSYFAFHRQVGQTVSAKFVSLFGPPRERDAPFATPGQPDPFGLTGTTLDRNQYYADVAASLQSVLEQVLVRQATHALRRTNTRHLCLAGGVALNSVANTAILQRSGASSLYIQPAAGDAGGALGAALYVQHALVGQAKRQTLTSAALGWSTDLLEDDGALTRLWARENVQAETFASDDRLLTRVVDHLAKGKVIGWMQGRAEFGPRALGHRSILADPRKVAMQHRVNAKIKFREPFRPFAPSVPAECAEVYFGLANAQSQYPARFMLYVAPVLKPDRLGAVTHVDGSARLQTVDRLAHPRYHQLLEMWGHACGTPVLLNTSFNRNGEPIVNTPRDALETFTHCGLDVLVVDRTVVEKR